MDSLENIPGIGPKTIDKLKRLDINTPLDLIYHFPRRYIDFRNTINISQVEENQNITIHGQISFIRNIYTRNHKNIQIATIRDQTGQINLMWFNQPFLLHSLKKGQSLSFAGTVSRYKKHLTIMNPIFGQYHTGKIIAIYPETQGLTSKWFRKTIQQNITSFTKNISDPLPPSIIKKYQLTKLPIALHQIHQPKNPQILTSCQIRLKLAEILSLQAQSQLQKLQWSKFSPRFTLTYSKKTSQAIKKLISSLPWQLTNSQKKVWQEIKTDLLSSNTPTNRLLQGDVGSGKTIVALLSCYLAHLNLTTSLLLAPTEILAQQHYQTFKKILAKTKTPIKLLTAASKLKTDKIPLNSIIISTHAAIYKKKQLEKKIGLFIIDEQHKFGVKQRSFLSTSLNPPHTITMTATPIPRTISLTMLGNLSLSTIKKGPKNRPLVKTFLVPQTKKTACYKWIRDQITTKKQQAFIVCPFIEPSETMSSVKSAKQEFEHLSNIVFPQLKLALIHGKIKSKDKEIIIKKFQKNQINILVTTPIIEVGIDIPNATIIIIQSADRFGLAQLHQLRGRVGRSQQQSYCYFFSPSPNSKAQNRLKFLQTHHNGLSISKYDLKTRGPGEVFSTLQHGFPSLKITTLSDTSIIKQGQLILKNIINYHPKFDLNRLINNSTTNTLHTN